jgi:beta-xylosidase
MSLEIGVVPVWRDTSKSTHDRVAALLAELTLEEKVGQLFGVWVGADAGGGEVAPHQNDMIDDVNLDDLLPHGIGQLTRPFGTAPVDPALGALSLQRTQERIVASNRLGIPAVAHEECLAGFATWGATAYPVPLAWGTSFDPALVREMARRIGSDMRAVGVHQGLAPVLDVVRDQRWGRVEETIGEDPYLVATVGTAYVQGLEESGIVATLKHFVGYSASKAGRNLAPVSIGPRELADVLLPPFEMALLEGGARSVMNSYTDLDGVPTAADRRLLTDLLRTTWGFEGTVVADYFAVGFLSTLHRIVPDGDWAAAAGVALAAGIDVELPTLRAYGSPLIEAVRDGRIDEALVDRAVRRVLAQKIELGLLDPDWSPVPPALRDGPAVRGSVDLDTDENRRLAARIAERALVLLRNDGILPLTAPRRIAVVGPTADDPYAVLGGYAFPTHVGVLHPDTPTGIALPTLLDAIRAEFPDSEVTFVRGTSIDGGETAEIPAAVAAARDADVVVLALGDRAGLFGRGTSGEGSDAEALDLPGAQQLLFDAMLGSGTPTVVTLLAGRPYALGHAATAADAILEAFFLGEEGTTAIAGALSGRVNPAGRLPVSIPAAPGAQPATYLAAPLARVSGVSSIDPTPAFWFGHGLSYTTFTWTDAAVSATAFTDTVDIAVTVTNTGARTGSEVVQLYLHDPVASVVRPVQRLISFARVDLEPGENARITFRVPAELSGFTGLDGQRIVEPGELVFGLGRSAGDLVAELPVLLDGAVRTIDHRAPRHAAVTVSRR